MDRYVTILLVHVASIYLFLNILDVAFSCASPCYFAFVGKIVTFLFLSTITFGLTKKCFLNEEVTSEKKAVFITGCDTGFGHQLAKRLDKKGYHVFASCLFPKGEGAIKLKETGSERLQVLGLDVTKDSSVEEAIRFVKGNLGGSKLWAIVNNAGILKGISVDFSTMDDFRSSIEVNALGPVRVTKAFMPLLRKSKGRVVNVTSLAGRVGFANATPYFMSKFAFVGFNECLRLELSAFGISVVSVEPEFFRTQLINREAIHKKLVESFETVDEDVINDYGRDYIEALKVQVDRFLDLASSNIEAVVEDMVKGVCLKYPDFTYKARRNSVFRFILYFHESMPSVVQDFFIKNIFGNSRIRNLK